MSRTYLKWPAIVFALVFVGVAAVCAGLGRWEAFPLIFGVILLAISLILGGLYAIGFVTVLVHEAGHFLAVRLTKSKPVSVMLPHLAFYFREGRYTAWRWRPLGGVSGMVRYTNPSVTLGRHVLIVAAGPIFNFLLAGLAWLVYLRTEGAEPFGLRVLNSAAFFFAMINGVTGVSNLVPYRMKSGLITDGGHLFGALFTPKASLERLQTGQRLTAEMHSRPRDKWTEEFAAKIDPTGKSGYGEMARYWHEMDRDNVRGAEIWLRAGWAKAQAEKKMVRELREAILYETATYFTRFVDDPELSAEAGAMAEKEFPRSERRPVLLAARAWMAGDRTEANRLVRTVWNRIAEIQPSEDLAQHVNDWFRRILDPSVPMLPVVLPAPKTEEEANRSASRGALG